MIAGRNQHFNPADLKDVSNCGFIACARHAIACARHAIACARVRWIVRVFSTIIHIPVIVILSYRLLSTSIRTINEQFNVGYVAHALFSVPLWHPPQFGHCATELQWLFHSTQEPVRQLPSQRQSIQSNSCLAVDTQVMIRCSLAAVNNICFCYLLQTLLSSPP